MHDNPRAPLFYIRLMAARIDRLVYRGNDCRYLDVPKSDPVYYLQRIWDRLGAIENVELVPLASDEEIAAASSNNLPRIFSVDQVATVAGTNPGSGQGGVTVHSALQGLSADDHPQYLNTVRGDERYYTQSQAAAMLAARAPLVNGLIPDQHIPAIAVTDYLGTVSDQTAMLALTGQKGDWCVRSDQGKVFVITGANPAQVSSWTALTYPALTQAQVTALMEANPGAFRSAMGLGGAALVNIGTTTGTVAAGDDARLSDARTPTSHKASHQSGGADAIKLDSLAAPDDNTNLNATTTAHGLLPKLPGGTTTFLRADGQFAAPTAAAHTHSWADLQTPAIVVTSTTPGDLRAGTYTATSQSEWQKTEAWGYVLILNPLGNGWQIIEDPTDGDSAFTYGNTGAFPWVNQTAFNAAGLTLTPQFNHIHTPDQIANLVAILASKADLSGGKLASSQARWIQQRYIEDATGKSSTVTIPLDDTIPQNNEGTSYDELFLTITPTNAANFLNIDVVLPVFVSTVGAVVASLFRDGTANAIRTGSISLAGSAYTGQIILRARVTAGNTSAQTFRVRFGRAAGSYTVYINDGASPYYGGAVASTMSITEIAA